MRVMRHHKSHNLNEVSQRSRKRKATDKYHMAEHPFFLNELNDDLLETILAWLPTSSFFRLRLVCKRWSSVAASAAFRIACSQIPFRHPWLFMVGQDLDQSTIFDTNEHRWKTITHQSILKWTDPSKSVTVASSGGLVGFRTGLGGFIVCNPVTGACRDVPQVDLAGETEALHAIAMHTSCDRSSYKIVLIFGELPNLCFKAFDSAKNRWDDKVPLLRKTDNSAEVDMTGDETIYFLSKAGDVVATNMQRSASKQYSSVLTVEEGEEVVYFLSHTGMVVSCNLVQRNMVEYPRLLPIYAEYSIDIVQCRGEMMLVLLSEFLETASLRVWKLCKVERSWQQVAAMPPWMSHELYGKKADINCVGCRDSIFICLNSSDFSSFMKYDFVSDEWTELPKYYVDGKAKEFMSAFSFEPRLEATV